ncbi:hypothetical protein KAU18_04475, partial [Candidatus Bathyarchaeota archaeon]|nr:hypothetical protein [Candidatus Bathyarchaeota archaeon]
MVGVSRFSVSVDPGLLEEFDRTIEGLGYNRSMAVQVAMRGFLSDHKWAEGEGEPGAHGAEPRAQENALQRAEERGGAGGRAEHDR